MRKTYGLLILLLVLVAGTFSSQAQIRFGVKAGLNVNSLNLKHMGETLDKENGCGFTGGVMTEIAIPLGGLAVDASLMYSHMTGKSMINVISEGSNSETVEMQQSKNFLEIPVNLKYKFGLPIVNNIVSPYLLTGPTFSFKFGDKKALLNTKDVQYSWNFGLGLEVVRHLQIQAAYSMGINNIVKRVGLADFPSDNIKLKNNYWTITAAYLF